MAAVNISHWPVAVKAATNHSVASFVLLNARPLRTAVFTLERDPCDCEISRQ